MLRAQSSEVDDATDSSTGGGTTEPGRRLPISLDEGLPAVHRVHQVVGLVHPGHRSIKRSLVQTISCDDLGAGASRRDTLGVTRQTPHSHTALFEHVQQAAANVSTGSGQQDQVAHGRSPLLARRHQHGVNHVNDAIAGCDVGFDNPCGAHAHGTAVDLDG